MSGLFSESAKKKKRGRFFAKFTISKMFGKCKCIFLETIYRQNLQSSEFLFKIKPVCSFNDNSNLRFLQQIFVFKK